MAIVSDELLNRIYNVLQDYGNVCTYRGERTGGVLAGCPRGHAPLPEELAQPAISVLRDLEAEVRPQMGG